MVTDSALWYMMILGNELTRCDGGARGHDELHRGLVIVLLEHHPPF